MEKKLSFMPTYNAFGIADSELTDCRGKYIPLIKMSDECYDVLGIRPPLGAPKVGFLLGREKDCYTMDFNYAYATVDANMEPVGLDYFNCTEQLADCAGLILPGGSFESPLWYYVDDEKLDHSVYPNERSKAYAYAFYTALHMGIPVLGICAGAQVMAAETGSHLVKRFKAPQPHKTTEMYAHMVYAVNAAMTRNILGVSKIETNSRHTETVRDFPTLDLYATAPGGVPEMWGSVKDNLLGVQWHPEDFVVKGDQVHKRIYDWLAEKARIYQRQKFLSGSFVIRG